MESTDRFLACDGLDRRPSHGRVIDTRIARAATSDPALAAQSMCHEGLDVNETHGDFEVEGYISSVKETRQLARADPAKVMLARIKLAEGDKLCVVEQTSAGIKLSPYEPKTTPRDGDRAPFVRKYRRTTTRRLAE